MFSKKLLILYIILLSICVLIMGSLMFVHSKSLSPHDLREIQKEGILRIVTEYTPSEYTITENQIEGFHYELCKTIANLSGLEVFIYMENSLEKSFEGLLSNHYDIVARNIPITSELKERFAFTDPIILSRQVLVQRTKAHNNGIEPLRNHLDLAEKTLYIPAESSHFLLRLRNLQHEIGDTIYVVEEPVNSSEQLIIMVVKGNIDYAVYDLQTALVLQKQYPEIDIKTDISFTQLQSWAVRKNAPTLLDSLNHWLRIIRENNQFDKIYQQYYQ